MAGIKAYKRLPKSMAQLVSLTKMYNADHPIVKEKAAGVYKELCEFFAENKQSIVLAKSADMLLMNGEKVPDDKIIMRFVADFFNLQVGSVELEPGLSLAEFDIFVRIMAKTENITGVDRLKQFLAEKEVVHLVMRAATFKLVQENEDVIKKGEFIKAEELRPEILEKFTKDFTEGKVPENLKKADKEYKAAAHNPAFLAGLTFDLLKAKDTPEDLERVLWLLADYLIDEIRTSREENMNLKILEDIKAKLFSMWKDDPAKQRMMEHADRVYGVINTALQLKGLLTLYARHKKKIESVVKKIKGILMNVPADSQLCRKTMDSLRGIGPVAADQDIFKI